MGPGTLTVIKSRRREWRAKQMETQEIQSLTPLRGIAAIWVICFHYAVVYFAFRPEQFSWVFNKGYLAVDIFFMLSGFVLSHVYWF
jgi:peptidoglycan/LPS O-acetylase OafA/YrhL